MMIDDKFNGCDKIDKNDRFDKLAIEAIINFKIYQNTYMTRKEFSTFGNVIPVPVRKLQPKLFYTALQFKLLS